MKFFEVFLINTSKYLLMDIENAHWDQADQEFILWLNGSFNESNSLYSDILKSIYLAFRQKEIERLRPFCEQAFDNYLNKESIKNQQVYEAEYQFDEVRFRIIQPSEAELKAKTKRENQRIIGGISSGDNNIFNELYEYEFPKVVRMIKKSGTIEMAKDVFQDAIVILVEKVYAKRIDLNCSVKTYLYSICKYLWLDQLRQNKKEKQMIQFYNEEFDSDEILIHFYSIPDIFDEVTSAINNLGNPCKQLLECFYYQNMSWEDIASSLGYSNAASARNQKYKCLERIRGNLINQS